MDFSGLYKKLKALKIEKLIDRAVLLNKEEIIDANTAQLSKGLRSDGSEISPGLANPFYAKEKKSSGGKAPLGVPDLKDEGDFYEGFYLESDSDGFEIGSKDSKESALQGKYGDKIFGLSDQSKENLKPQITEELITLIKEQL